MVKEKRKHIKTADFESKARALIKDIEEDQHLTKTAVIASIYRLMKDLVEMEEPEFEIIKELRRT